MEDYNPFKNKIVDAYLSLLNKLNRQTNITDNQIIGNIESSLVELYSGIKVGHYTKNGMTYIYSKQNDVETDVFVIDKKSKIITQSKQGTMVSCNVSVKHIINITVILVYLLEKQRIPIRRIKDFISLSKTNITKQFIVTSIELDESEDTTMTKVWGSFSKDFIFGLVPSLFPDGTDRDMKNEFWFNINHKLMYTIQKREAKKLIKYDRVPLLDLIKELETLMDKHMTLTNKEDIIELYDRLYYFKNIIV